jgi:hypothetical protein
MSNVQFESVDGNFYDIAGQQGLIDPATGMPAPAQPAQPPVTRTRTSATEFVRDGRRIRQTVYSDGTTTEVDLGPDDSRTFQAPTFTPRQDARNTIRAVLATFGLDKLSDVLYDKYAREEVNISNPDALIFSVRDTTEYQARFAANARRAAKNLPELDPASYLALDNPYRDLMRSNGFDPGFYDQTTDFEKFIENDISPSELQSRLAQGFRKVADADPEVKRQMKELYGVDETGLAQYFIDPERSQPLLEKRARAAQIAARAREQAGLQIGAVTAEELASRGITPEEAQQRFAQMGRLAGLYQEMGTEQALTEQQKIGAAFGTDVQAEQELQRRQRERVAGFTTGGQFARTSGITSGTVETGAGTAQ